MVYLKYMLSGMAGLSIWFAATHGIPYYQVLELKLSGKAPYCSWRRTIELPASAARFGSIRQTIAAKTKVVDTDQANGIVQVETPVRRLWVRAAGADMNGPDLLSYLITEQRWVEQTEADHYVKPGDIVLDVGAHVGVFTTMALERGASKVVLFEPDPTNVECIRRNFASEIAGGRVVLFAEGAWSSESTLDFNRGLANSGTGSMVHKEAGSETITVRVRPIDVMVKEAGLPRVDFIKMDIEGAEREALKGASQTLRTWKPRLMLDSYHLGDDPVVLPRVIGEIEPRYKSICGPCEFNSNQGEKVQPHVTFYY